MGSTEVVVTGRTMGSSETVTPWSEVGPGPGSSTVVEVVLVEVDDEVDDDEEPADEQAAATRPRATTAAADRTAGRDRRRRVG